MEVDYIIVGQGICGTLLSWFLQKEKKRFVVYDEPVANTASKIAAGVINPVTGRRYAYTWMIDEIIPFALETYSEMELYFGKKIMTSKSIIDFFPTVQMLHAFIDRLAENDTYLHSYPEQNHFNESFTYDFGCGEVSPCYLVHITSLLSEWNKHLRSQGFLREEKFETIHLRHSHEIIYQDLVAKKLIFCDGSAGVNNPWFHLLPFAPNKGEALIIHSEGLNQEHIFKKGLMLVPMIEPDTFWVGSNYQWTYEDQLPSLKFLDHATTLLKGWLKKPFQVLHHWASLRPATLERRPFVGFHPLHPAIGILNGMGTKGTSLAPYFAHQLVQHLLHEVPIQAEADIKRFGKILSRS